MHPSDMTDEQLRLALFNDHIRELRKYTFGELLKAIDEHHCATLRYVGRTELVSFGKYKSLLEKACGGPAAIIVFRQGNLSKEDVRSLERAFPEDWENIREP